MRKPRDIDAELQALSEKAKLLKQRKVQQLGELVIATHADRLDADVLAGALITAAQSKDTSQQEAWRKKGASFFYRPACKGSPEQGRGVARTAPTSEQGDSEKPGDGAPA